MNSRPAKAKKIRGVHWFVSAALILFGIMMVASLAIQNFSSQYLIEHEFWAHLLDEVSADHAKRLRVEGPIGLPVGGIFRSWYIERGAGGVGMPESLVDLEPGYYSTEGGFRNFTSNASVEGVGGFHALIVNAPPGRLITVVDIDELENDQNLVSLLSLVWLFVSIVLIGGVIIWLQVNLVLPVRDLAARVQSIDPGRVGERLPTSYKQEEVLIIAQASNIHLARVEQFIERERSLLDQASHEFRTPIAVIAGATDILKQNALPASSQPALARIEHAVADLSETMVALLYLAREPERGGEPEDVTALHELLPRLVRDHEHLLAGKAAVLRVGDIEPTYLTAPDAMVRIAVSNLIRNAVESTETGSIDVSLTNGVVSVIDSGSGFDPVEAARRYRDSLRIAAPTRGQGLGLFLISRICERFGWKLVIDSTSNGGTCARIDLASSVIPL